MRVEPACGGARQRRRQRRRRRRRRRRLHRGKNVHVGRAGEGRVGRVLARRCAVPDAARKEARVRHGELVEPEVGPQPGALLGCLALQPVSSSALVGEAQQQFLQVLGMVSLGLKGQRQKIDDTGDVMRYLLRLWRAAAAAAAPRSAAAARTYVGSTGQTTVTSTQSSRLSAAVQPCEPESPQKRTSPGRFLVPRTLPPSSLLRMCAWEAHMLAMRHKELWSVLYSLSPLAL